MANKIESTYATWLASIEADNLPPQIDVSTLFELAYQIYLAKQNGDPQWQKESGGKWLAEKLTEDGRFTNQHINRLSYLLDDVINYNHWLYRRNNEQ